MTITDLGNEYRSNRVTTGSKGDYAFSSLKPSHYKISVNAPGFKASLIADVELHTQDALAENVALARWLGG